MATQGAIHNLGVEFVRRERDLHGKLVAWSIPALRITVGIVFLAFGLLKFFPDVSPAQELAETTFGKLSFGLVPGGVAIIGIAALESFIGLCLILNRWMRLAVWLLAFELIGILSPLVLLPGRLFGGPDGAPTLEGQYVIKDIVLVAAAMVIAAGSFRRGHMVREEAVELVPPEVDPRELDSQRRLEVVLGAASHGIAVDRVCELHGISEVDYYAWRDAALGGAAEALDRQMQSEQSEREAPTS